MRLGGEVISFSTLPTLHVHLDESGNLDFSPSGSRYFVFGVAWTFSPRQLADRLQAYRFDLLKQGLHAAQEFHAQEDPPPVRQRVVDLIRSEPAWQFAASVVDKRKVHPRHPDMRLFYWRFASVPLRFVLASRIVELASSVLIYTDRFPKNVHRESSEKGIKQACAAALREKRPYRVFHHASASNSWLQVADYCAWAVLRKHEHGDSQPYKRLRPRRARKELDVLAAVEKTYY